MTLARVEIDSTGATTCALKIDGKDVASYVVGYDLSARVNGIPNVTLHLVGLSRVDLARADVVLPTYVVEGLTALGWLPPERVSVLRELADKGWPDTVYDAESVGVMMLRLLDEGADSGG
jgi:hypothetical protein